MRWSYYVDVDAPKREIFRAIGGLFRYDSSIQCRFGSTLRDIVFKMNNEEIGEEPTVLRFERGCALS
jgi:hypothetical protein